MNTINVSTGFLPFQLRMGWSPQLIPPLVAIDTPVPEEINHSAATDLIERIERDVSKAQDNLLAAKISQSEFSNLHRGEEIYKIGD